MSNRRSKLTRKTANSKSRKHDPNKGPGRFAKTVLPRASKLRGRLARLEIGRANTPKSKDTADLDYKNYTYRKPGSMQ